MLLAVAGIFYLTWEAAAHHDWEASKEQGMIRDVVEIDKEDPAYAILEANTCLSCHGENLEGSVTGPNLVGTELSAEEIMDIAVNGRGRCLRESLQVQRKNCNKSRNILSQLKNKI